MEKPCILIVEDNIQLRKFIAKNLLKSGYEVFEAESLKTAYNTLSKYLFDLVLLDLQLDQSDGMEILSIIRRQNAQLPVIIVSSNAQLETKLQGFDRGCDDYITKPFYIDELLSRVKRKLKTNTSLKSTNTIIMKEINSGPFVLNLKDYTLKKNGKIIPLRKKLFELMLFFVQNPKTVLSKKNLFDYGWDSFSSMNANSLYVHINDLRALIEDDKSKPVYIKNIRNVGYFYAPNELENSLSNKTS